MRTHDYKVGDRVVLKSNEKEEWPEERGVVTRVEAKFPGMFLVKVDLEYATGPGDDRVREIHQDNMEPQDAAKFKNRGHDEK